MPGFDELLDAYVAEVSQGWQGEKERQALTDYVAQIGAGQRTSIRLIHNGLLYRITARHDGIMVAGYTVERLVYGPGVEVPAPPMDMQKVSGDPYVPELDAWRMVAVQSLLDAYYRAHLV